jgi:epsilon-lactone hydrolase
LLFGLFFFPGEFRDTKWAACSSEVCEAFPPTTPSARWASPQIDVVASCKKPFLRRFGGGGAIPVGGTAPRRTRDCPALDASQFCARIARMPSTRSRLVYDFLQTSGPPSASASLEDQRRDLERQARLARMPSRVEVQDTAVGSMHAEWLRPRDANPDRALLYLHGGGYTTGSCNTHRALAARIAKAANVAALLIDYRLAPEHPFPAALLDAKNAYWSLVRQGIQADKIVVAGDSAGGGLAVALAVGLRDQAQALPGAVVCISPWLDLTLTGETLTSGARTDPLVSWETSVLHARRYVGQHLPGEPLISPLFAELLGLPPMLLQVGEHEVLRSDSERFAQSARQAGVQVTLEVWPGMWHVWHGWAGVVPESTRAIERIGAFIQERMGA